MDLALLEQEYISTLGSVGTPVAPAAPTGKAMTATEPDQLVSVWRGTTHSSAVAHESLRGMISSPLVTSAQEPNAPINSPMIGLSILAPDESEVLPGTVVSSPVLESKKFAAGTPEFTQWEPKM